MDTIEIKITEYYNDPQYYPYMPETVYNALERAFLDGKDTAEVPKGDFDSMLAAMQATEK
jgi:hypothetical protein